MKNLDKYLSLLGDKADGLLLTSRYSRHYGAEFDIAEGVAVVSAKGCRYFTDSRYIESAQNGIKGFEVIMTDREHPFTKLLNTAIEEFGITTLGYEENYLTVAEYQLYEKKLNAKLVPMHAEISGFRSVKEDWELDNMRKAQAIADKAFAEICTRIKAGMTEKELQAELIYCLYKNGGEGLSFDPIVVSGPNTSLPHGVAGERIIQEGDFSHKVNMGGNDELTILGNEFNHLTERLNTSEQKRRRFVSDASHELKTPLASIKLLSDSILQNDMDVATIREFVGDIGREADRLTRMSEKLLSLTKIDAQLETDSEIIYMSPTVERVIRMLNKLAEKKNISLSMDIKEDSTVLFQEDDLYEIIFNLVENAIKYNVVGGTVNVTVLRDEDNAIIKVQDSGVGIPQDAQTHIFERFFRVDKARSRNSGGSGLGLAIVRNMVEHNNGTIAVESIVGQGTTFTVTFPVFDIDDMADTMYES